MTGWFSICCCGVSCAKMSGGVTLFASIRSTSNICSRTHHRSKHYRTTRESQEVFSNAAHGDNHHHSTVRLQSITCSSETRLSSSQDTAYVTDHVHCSIASGLAKYNILTNCTMASLSMVSHHRSQTCSPQAHRSSTVFLWKHLEITTVSSYTPGVLTECTGFLSATPSFFSSVVPHGLEVF